MTNTLSAKERSQLKLQSELRRYGFYLVVMAFASFIFLMILPLFSVIPIKCPKEIMPIKLGNWNFSMPGLMLIFGLMLIANMGNVLAKKFGK